MLLSFLLYFFCSPTLASGLAKLASYVKWFLGDFWGMRLNTTRPRMGPTGTVAPPTTLSRFNRFYAVRHLLTPFTFELLALQPQWLQRKLQVENSNICVILSQITL